MIAGREHGWLTRSQPRQALSNNERARIQKHMPIWPDLFPHEAIPEEHLHVVVAWCGGIKTQVGEDSWKMARGAGGGISSKIKSLTR